MSRMEFPQYRAQSWFEKPERFTPLYYHRDDCPHTFISHRFSIDREKFVLLLDKHPQKIYEPIDQA